MALLPAPLLLLPLPRPLARLQLQLQGKLQQQLQLLLLLLQPQQPQQLRQQLLLPSPLQQLVGARAQSVAGPRWCLSPPQHLPLPPLPRHP